MPTRFAGARCIISGSMPINRRKLQVPRLTFSKQGRLWRSLSRGLRVVPLRRRLLLLHRQLPLVPHLLQPCGLLPHRGAYPYQGLARPHGRAHNPRCKTGCNDLFWGRGKACSSNRRGERLNQDYGSAILTKHMTSWTDGRVAIGGESQQDAFTDRQLATVSATPTSIPTPTVTPTSTPTATPTARPTPTPRTRPTPRPHPTPRPR
jgi:hypothetical protein